MRIAYIGWLVGDNIGDEMLYKIFQKNYKLIQGEKIEIIPVDLPNHALVDRADVVVLGGGSLLLPGYISQLCQRLKEGKQIAVWGTGYDWCDKKYVQLARDKQDVCQLWQEPERTELEAIVRASLFFLCQRASYLSYGKKCSTR